MPSSHLWSHNERRLMCFLLSAILFLLSVGFDVKREDGFIGRTQKNGNGCTCHSFTPDGAVNVWVQGPTTLQTGALATYTINMTGGPALGGGYNVAVREGSLSPPNAESKLIDDELSHSATKAFSGSTVSWAFTYQAPATPGVDTIYAVGLSVNHNGIPDLGDRWNFSPKLPVRILASFPAVPAASEWGLAILGVVIFAGGAVLLTRRSYFRPSC